MKSFISCAKGADVIKALCLMLIFSDAYIRLAFKSIRVIDFMELQYDDIRIKLY